MKTRKMTVMLAFAGTLGAVAAVSGGGLGSADVAAAAAAAARASAGPAAWDESGYTAEQVARGKKLVGFGACNDCHTPWKLDPEVGLPIPDMSRMLSGHPEGAPEPQGALGEGDLALIGPTFTSFRLPFGVVRAPNLTPDDETGTGLWTEDMFLGVFRKARHLGGNGRPVLPPMPWPMTASLPDEDIIAIYAYLRTIPPIRNHVQIAQPPAEVQAAIAKSNDVLLARVGRGEPFGRKPSVSQAVAVARNH